MITLRRDHPVFRRKRFLTGAAVSDLEWFTPAGTTMNDQDWVDPNARAIAIHLDGADDPDRDADGNTLTYDVLLVLVNGWWEPPKFAIPDVGRPARWQWVLDTYRSGGLPDDAPGLRCGDACTVGPQSIVILRARRTRSTTSTK